MHTSVGSIGACAAATTSDAHCSSGAYPRLKMYCWAVVTCAPSGVHALRKRPSMSEGSLGPLEMHAGQPSLERRKGRLPCARARGSPNTCHSPTLHAHTPQPRAPCMLTVASDWIVKPSSTPVSDISESVSKPPPGVGVAAAALPLAGQSTLPVTPT
eukprot:354423-Chlamydomonas_euryale.AAC.8